MPNISTPRMTCLMVDRRRVQNTVNWSPIDYYRRRLFFAVSARGRFRRARTVLALRRRGRSRRGLRRVEPRIAGTCVEHLEDADQPALHFREPFFRVAPQQFLNGRGFGLFEHRRRLVFDAPPYAGERQAVGEDQLLDAQDALDVGAPVNARAARRFRHAQVGKLRLPRSQDVRLHAGDFAHF